MSDPETISETSTAIVDGDPHVVGFDGRFFDFMGEDGKWYAFISAGNMQFNVRLKKYTEGTTFIDEVGVKIGTPEVGYTKIYARCWPFSATINEQPFKFGGIKFPSGLGKSEAYAQLIGDYLEISNGSFRLDVQTYMKMYDNHCYHFDVRAVILPFGVLCDGIPPHGILGQTIYTRRVKILGEMKHGKDKDYEVSGLYDHDFKYNRFGVERMVKPKYGVGDGSRTIAYL